MLYEYDLTIPANTKESSPTRSDVLLSEGVITHVEAQYPEGCGGLAHARVYHREHQILPTNTSGNLKADGYVIAFDTHIDLPNRPYDLILRGWNDDDTYPHTITFRFGITPKRLALLWLLLPEVLRKAARGMRVTVG